MNRRFSPRAKSLFITTAVIVFAVATTAVMTPQAMPETGDWFDGSDDSTESSDPAESAETSEPSNSTESSNETEPESVDQEARYTTDFQYGSDACESGADDDSLNMSEESQYGTNPCVNDTDGDGLPDDAEVTRENLSKADPTRMDVFIELDYISGNRPKNETLQTVIEAYANSPVDNPDGSTGISLHIVVDDVLPTRSDTTNLSVGVDIMESHFDHVGDGYRYGLIVTRLSNAPLEQGKFRTGTSVTSPGWNRIFMIEGTTGPRKSKHVSETFMHELGHSVGLHPGLYRGIDSYNESLKYDSIMHYKKSMTDYSHGEPFDEWQYIETSMTTPPVGNDTATIPARESAK